MTQGALDLRPLRRARPAERTVDPALRLALSLLLHSRHQGRARAATWAALATELEAEGMFLGSAGPRRCQEAGEALLAEGVPVVGLSADGVWLAETAEEIEVALREAERRARRTLRRRRLLRTVWRELVGQERLRGGEPL